MAWHQDMWIVPHWTSYCDVLILNVAFLTLLVT
jgi:hypothetical protein